MGTVPIILGKFPIIMGTVPIIYSRSSHNGIGKIPIKLWENFPYFSLRVGCKKNNWAISFSASCVLVLATIGIQITAAI